MIPLWESRGLIGSLLDLFYEILARFVLAVRILLRSVLPAASGRSLLCERARFTPSAPLIRVSRICRSPRQAWFLTSCFVVE